MLLATLAFVLGEPQVVGAYNEAIHSLLDRDGLPAQLLQTSLAPPTLADADLLRERIWRAGSAHPDAGIRARFLARYPTAAGFDRWAFKELIGLNPEAIVVGIDREADLGSSPTVGTVLALGARLPDDDRRNQDRFAHDADRRIRRDSYGRPLPADPAQLAMGPLSGPASQSYAHYGLPRGPLSDDPEVLKKDPRRFAYPPTAMAFAPAFAQLHTDLALCAATLGSPGGPALGWLLLGNAHHYLEDVANQIHTLQAIYGFFRDAKLGSYVEELRSLGGLFRSRPDFVTIAIAIIRNHHILAESLFAKRVEEHRNGRHPDARVAAALDALRRGDAALEQHLGALTAKDPFARRIAEAVIEASGNEGAEVYEAIRKLARPELSHVGVTFEEGMDPDPPLRNPPDSQVLERLYALQAAGFARAGTAIRRHVQLFEVALAENANAATFDLVAGRLLATQLDWLDERDARLASFVPSPPPRDAINWLVPGGLAVVLAVLGLVGVLAVRRMRR